MSILRTYNVQNPDSASVNVELSADGGVRVAGLSTFSGELRVGTGVTISGGIITATTFTGNVTGNLTGNVTATGLSTFSGGINVGTGASISSPSSNTLALGTNSVEAVRIDSSGKVGIKTTNPQYALHVVGAGGTEIVARFDSGGSQDCQVLIGGPSSRIGETYLAFQNGDTGNNAWLCGFDDDEQFKVSYGDPKEIQGNSEVKTIVTQGGDFYVGILTTANVAFLKKNGGGVGLGTVSTTTRESVTKVTGVGTATGNLIYNSTNACAEVWNGSVWVRLNYPGDSADNYASSVTELVNAGLTGKDYFWMNTTDGGVQETFCDLDTADSSGGKGWMLVASMSDAAEWGRPGYSIRGRLPVYTPWNSEFNTGYEAGVTNWWSANWGNRNINYIRFTNTNDIFSHIGPGTWEGSDWYFYWSSAINYKQVWSWGSGTNKNYINDSSGTSDGNINASFHSGWPNPVNNGTTVNRVCMRGFNSAYNIKLSYSVNQRWNNFADSGGSGTTQSWADWWSILTTPTYQYAYETSTSINPNLYSVSGTSDGSVAILPSGSSSTTAGQDCAENNAKCGRDDDSPSASWSNTSTASVGENTITDYRRSFYIWIK